MKIICISGKAQHGKDATAQIMKEQLESDGYSVLLIHYADLLKHICKSFFGWDGAKDEKGRHILQYVGTDVIRKQRPDFWVEFVADMLAMFPDAWDFVLIPDCRFPNEIAGLTDAGFETTLLRVVRPGFASPLTAEQQRHPSETALDDTEPDYYIKNCGTIRDLREAVADWIVQFNGHHQVSFDEMGDSGMEAGTII